MDIQEAHNSTCTVLMISVRYCILQVMALTLAVGYVLWTVSPKIGSAVQAAQKTIKQREHRVTDPIKIVNLSANSKPIKLDERFSGDSNWLRGMSIRLKNVTDKTITFVEIQFNFPETRGSQPEMSFRSELGKQPWDTSNVPPLVLGPNEEVTFQLKDGDYEDLVRFISNRTNLRDLSTVELKIGFVVFDDGMAWQNGIYLKQDINNPRRWVPLSN